MLKFEVGTPIELAYKKPVIKPVKQKTKKPKLTVQITSYNERDDLIKCLDSLFSQSFKDFEVVLVDNGLDKDIVSKIKNYDLIYINAGSNLGCCGGRNLGAAYASGELIAFVDADGYVAENFLENAVKELADNNVVAVRGKVLPFEVSDDLPGHYNLGDKPGLRLIDTEGCSIWRTDDYRKTGGFEDSLAGGEGLVLCYRMVKLYGYSRDSFRYSPSFVLYHDFHSNKSQLAKKLYKQAVARDAIEKRYPDISELEVYYRDKGPKPITRRDLKIATIAEQTKAQVQEEYQRLYENKKLERIAKPNLVKGQSSYDFCVVIPCFNLGSLVKEAVDSVLRQSIKSVQIIVVDDASTDENTPEALKGLERLVEIVYLKQNGGVAAARNAGIQLAKAEYILCLDADDTIQPTYLEKAKSLFEINDEVGIVSCWARYHGEAKSIWKPKVPITLGSALVRSPIPTASCFRKAAWKQVGGYESRIRGYEDWELWINIMKHGWQVDIIPDTLFNYLVRPDSKVKTSNKNLEKILAIFFEKHHSAFEANLKYVFTEKHRETVNLREENRALKAHAFRTVIAHTKPGKILLKGRSAAVQIIEHLNEVRDDYKKTGSIVEASKSLSDKSRRLAHKVKRSLRK